LDISTVFLCTKLNHRLGYTVAADGGGGEMIGMSVMLW